MSIPSIPARELKARLDSGARICLLDVREEDERNYCAISPTGMAADLHIPMSEIPASVAEVAALGGPIVVYCHHGVRSMVAARWMASRGVVGLLNLDGGIDAWSVEVDAGVPRY